MSQEEWLRISDPGFMAELSSSDEAVRNRAVHVLADISSAGHRSDFAGLFDSLKEKYEERIIR